MNTPIKALNLALLSLLLAATLSACNDADSGANESLTPIYASRPAPPPVCNNCGTIISIETMKSKGKGSGFGAVAGAVAGAVVGHQIGDGRGQDAATVAGAIGGGFAGNEIEKRAKGTTYYHVTINMESGGSRTLDVDALNGLAAGSKVKVIGDSMQIAAGT